MKTINSEQPKGLKQNVMSIKNMGFALLSDIVG